jgi:IS30 family transposase
MSEYITFEKRLEIESMLAKGFSFGEMARWLNKDRSTISREVRNHSFEEKTGYSSIPFNCCRNRTGCQKTYVCTLPCQKQSTRVCRQCSSCNDNCPDFEEEVCITRLKPPYVCNGCDERNRCTLVKTMYYATEAHKKAEKRIPESRRGVLTSEQELIRLNDLVTPLILQGNSVHQIYVNNIDGIMCSEKTLYNYIDNCFFDARNIDLPRKVKYRPRRKKQEFKVDRGCYVNRTYDLFQKHLEKYPNDNPVQMDSVIGITGGKVLLTIHFPNTSFMLAFIRNGNTSQSVIDVFDKLYALLGRKLFEKLFPVILTDRGSEFSNPSALEKTSGGIRRTSIFYCDPNAPFQKGALEVNHELVRRVLPKGSSFDHLTQEDIDLMMCHINSYRRKKLNNKTPFEAFEFYYGKEILQILGYNQISDNGVILTPKLLKR